jgi:hypothetical protein
MSNGERKKLDRLLINIELLADVEKAAKNVGISSKLLHRWMNTPEFRRVIEHAVTEGKRLAKSDAKTFVPLWDAPEARSDRRSRAKLASRNLKAAKGDILMAIEDNDKAFFIDLGKCLSGEIDPILVDQRDYYVLGLLTRYPSITATDAVAQLARVGFPQITEENFRVLKKRLRGKMHTVHDHNAPRYAMREWAGS